LHHLIIKLGLFMLAEDWGGAIKRLRGSAKMAPLGAALFVLFSLSLVGMPPLPGFWAKFTLITELAGQSEPLYLIGLAVFLLATVIEASYLFRVAAILYQDAPRETLDHEIPKNEGLSLVTATLFGAGLIAAAVMIAPVGDSLNTIAAQVQDVDLYISTVFLGGNQ
ncbi:MAG: proton-conducting transporter membrane subunit, partial [Candidatus Thiodiazotropha sp.]